MDVELGKDYSDSDEESDDGDESCDHEFWLRPRTWPNRYNVPDPSLDKPSDQDGGGNNQSGRTSESPMPENLIERREFARHLAGEISLEIWLSDHVEVSRLISEVVWRNDPKDIAVLKKQIKRMQENYDWEKLKPLWKKLVRAKREKRQKWQQTLFTEMTTDTVALGISEDGKNIVIAGNFKQRREKALRKLKDVGDYYDPAKFGFHDGRHEHLIRRVCERFAQTKGTTITIVVPENKPADHIANTKMHAELQVMKYSQENNMDVLIGISKRACKRCSNTLIENGIAYVNSLIPGLEDKFLDPLSESLMEEEVDPKNWLDPTDENFRIAEKSRFQLETLEQEVVTHQPKKVHGAFEILEPGTGGRTYQKYLNGSQERSLLERAPLALERPPSTNVFLDAVRLNELWSDALPHLHMLFGLDFNWMPVLGTMELKPGHVQMKFFNIDQPDEIRSGNIKDHRLLELRNILDKQMERIRKVSVLEEGQVWLRDQSEIPHGEAIDGLNAMFAVQMAMEFFQSRNSGTNEAQNSSNKTLANALKVHCYLNMAQVGYGATQDVGKVVNLTRNLVMAEHTGEKILSRFSSTMSRSLGFAGEALGFLFSLTNVGLDIVELANSDNEAQKAVFATQLAFDGLNVGVTAASTVAGIMGAASVGAALGAAGALLAGIGIGVGALVQVFGEIAQRAEAVGIYFADTKQSYTDGGYRYDSETGYLMPLPGAVIKKLNFCDNTVTFDSQFLYPAPDPGVFLFPSVLENKEQAINVREALYVPNANGRIPVAGDLVGIVLPYNIKAYISVEWTTLPFSLQRHERGFDLLRRIQGDNKGRWCYNFYYWPTEYIVYKIQPHYVSTPVDVHLPQRDLRIEIPPLHSTQNGFLEFVVCGGGAQYNVGLRPGSSIKLIATQPGTTWILDGRNSPGGIQFDSKDRDSLRVGQVSVRLDNKNAPQIFVLTSGKETFTIELNSQIAVPYTITGDKWDVKHDETLKDYLHNLQRQNHLHAAHVMIDNYTVPELNKNVGRAFYEVSRDRLLYTKDLPSNMTESAQLGGVFGNDVYFYFATEECHALWRTNAFTGSLEALYQPLYDSTHVRLKRVNQCGAGSAIYATYSYLSSDLKELKGDLTYIVHPDSMDLASVSDPFIFKEALILPHIGKIISFSLRKRYAEDKLPKHQGVDGHVIKAKFLHPFLTLASEERDGETTKNHRYFCWIRLSDGFVIDSWKQFFSKDFCFVGSVPVLSKERDEPDEEVIFHSPEQNVLQRLFGLQDRPISEPIMIPEAFSKLTAVAQHADRCVLTTDAGYILQLIPGGGVYPIAVNATWLSSHHDESGSKLWWEELAGIARKNNVATLAVLGITVEGTARSVTVWYHCGRIVVASHELHGQSSQVLGISKDGQWAFICSFATSECRLFRQALIPDRDLCNTLSRHTATVKYTPGAYRMLPDRKLSSINWLKETVQCVDKHGIRFSVKDDPKTAVTPNIELIGVTGSWRKKIWNSRQTVESELSLLTQRWPSSLMLVLEGFDDFGSLWYNSATGDFYSFFEYLYKRRELDPYKDWIGLHAFDSKIGYVFTGTRNDKWFCQMEANGYRKLWKSSLVTISNGTFVVSLPAQETVYLPPISGIEHCIVMFDRDYGGSRLSISEQTWKHYKSITVANYDAAVKANGIFLETDRLTKFISMGYGNDEVLIDPDTGRSITLTGAGRPLGNDNSNFVISSVPHEMILSPLLPEHI